MNQRELGELRRRFRPEKSAISRVYGCYVNSSREIIAYIDQSLGLMPQEEAEKYLGLLKKALSGTLGRNLIDIVFSTQQVADSEEHRLLSALRTSELKDAEARDAFYQQVIGSLDMGENNYLILLGADAYDVPHRGKDGEVDRDACEEVFRYFVCCVCPVKDGTPELGYFHGENEFHISMEKQIVGQPELGFLFPAFDDRTANLYNALFYSRKPDELHQEFIDAVFRTEPPMSAAEQRETFQSALCGTLEGACSMEVVQSVHDYLRQRIQEHKESRDPEPLAVTAGEVSGVLRRAGGAGGGVPNRLRPVLWRGGADPGQPDRRQALRGQDRRRHYPRGPGAELSGGGPGHRRTALPAGSGGRECGGQRSGGPDCRRQRRRRDYINREEGIC